MSVEREMPCHRRALRPAGTRGSTVAVDVMPLSEPTTQQPTKEPLTPTCIRSMSSRIEWRYGFAAPFFCTDILSRSAAWGIGVQDEEKEGGGQ